MEKPAIEGGTPIRPDKIYYGRQCVTEDDVKAVAETLTSPFITCGPKVDEVEEKLEEAKGSPLELPKGAQPAIALISDL